MSEWFKFFNTDFCFQGNIKFLDLIFQDKEIHNYLHFTSNRIYVFLETIHIAALPWKDKLNSIRLFSFFFQDYLSKPQNLREIVNA